MNARELALDLLNRWPKSHLLADELLDSASSSVDGPDRGFVTELFYGCLRRKLSLDFLFAQFVTKPPRPPSPMPSVSVSTSCFSSTTRRTLLSRNGRAGPAPRRRIGNEIRQCDPASRPETRPRNAAGEVRRHSRNRAMGVLLPSPMAVGAVGGAPGPRTSRGIMRVEQSASPLYPRLNTLKTSQKPTGIAAEPTNHPLCWRVTNTAELLPNQIISERRVLRAGPLHARCRGNARPAAW